jgi:dTMP kinase
MYIILEGIDGAGKSTQIEFLKYWLSESGVNVKKIAEPSDSEVGKLIRKILKYPNADSPKMQKTLGLLFAADRLILMDEIADAEKEGKVVISDRSFYSSLAYQDHKDWIATINKFAKKPDLVILLDIDPDLAISRCSGTDTFENTSFLRNVRNSYLDLCKKENFKIIDGSNGENKVKSDIKKVVAPLFGICIDSI